MPQKSTAKTTKPYTSLELLERIKSELVTQNITLDDIKELLEKLVAQLDERRNSDS